MCDPVKHVSFSLSLDSWLSHSTRSSKKRRLARLCKYEPASSLRFNESQGSVRFRGRVNVCSCVIVERCVIMMMQCHVHPQIASCTRVFRLPGRCVSGFAGLRSSSESKSLMDVQIKIEDVRAFAFCWGCKACHLGARAGELQPFSSSWGDATHWS